MRKSNLFSIAFFFTIMLSALGVNAQPTTPVLDDFSGSLSKWTGGITGTGDCQISSGVLVGLSGTDECYYSASTFGANQEVFVTFPNAASHANDVTMRVFACLHDSIGTATVDSYGFRYRKVTGAGPNDVIQLFSMTNGSFTNIGSSYSAVEFSSNDRVAMIIDSSNYPTSLDIEVFLDTGSGWASIISHTESTTVFDCSSTNTGAYLPDATHQVDNFGGGTTVSGQNLLGMPPIFFN